MNIIPEMKNSSIEQLNTIRRLATNATSLLASDITARLATFILYTMIARYLGAFEFGQLSLGLTLFQSFQLLAIGGMKNLIIREVAKDRAKTDQYLMNASLVITVFSLISVLVLVIFANIMQYSKDTTSIILLLALGLLPFALSVVCDALFQAWERMYFITYANVVVNIGKVVLGFLLLSQGYSLRSIVLLLLFTHIATLIFKWWLILRHIVTQPRFLFNFSFCLYLTRTTVTFFGMDGLMAIMTSYSVILLSKLAGEVEVGLLSASTQLMVPMSMVFENIILSTFPMMCQSFDPSYERLKRISQRLLELLCAIVLPVSVGLFALAEALLLLLYGNQDFSRAAGALQILVGVLVLRVFTHVLGRVLIASLREKVVFRILMVNLGVTVILAPILISQFGLMGAAAATLIVRIIDAVQHYISVSGSFSRGLGLSKIIWKPIVASAAMGLYLVVVKDQNLWFIIASGALVYGTIMAALTIWSIGGPQQLKSRYLYLWSSLE